MTELSEIRERAAVTSSTLAQVFRGQSKELRQAERDRAWLLAELNRQAAQLEEIRAAWNVPGRAPGHHRLSQDNLRRGWPVLARALERLPK